MPLQQNFGLLVNQPVGVSLKNGQGVSGVLCGYDHEKIYLLQYLYHNQFATMKYSYNEIQMVLPFPRCQTSGPQY